MFENAKNVGKAVFGTCREAGENYKYDDLVARYGEQTAEVLIKEQLADSGLTIDQFRTYKLVKKVVQNGGLDVAQAHREAKQAATQALVNF